MDPLRQSHQLSRTPTTLTNDDIEAVIQMATSSRPSPDGRSGPLKDTRTQLFVGNLPYRVRWQDLKDLFRRAGTVLRADVSLGPDNRSRGYGTVLLATAEDAGRAIDLFNGYSWQTRILEVRPDRLPPDFDASIAPPFSAPNQPFSRHSEDLDYSALLDLHHNFPGTSTNPCRNLFVGNLPFHCQWQDLKDLFRQAGTIMRADVALGQDGRSRGFGTVVFATELDAERAVKMFNGYEYNGRALKVNFDKFTQVGLPSTLVPNSTGTSGVGSSMSPVSPAMSYASTTADLRIPAPAPYNGRQLPSHTQPAKLGYPRDLNGISSGSASPLDVWGLSLQQKRDKDREDREREREVSHSFHHLDIRSRTSSGVSSQMHSAPAASRSTSTSSSTKPPSLGQTSSSGSGISSSSSVAASVSTSSTSEKSNPPSIPLPPHPPSPPRHQSHRRLSSSHVRNAAASTSSSSSPSLLQSRQHNSHQSASSHHPHPHHPGTISLPPPPHVTSFPLHPHNMSPHGMMGMSISPLHHPLGSPSSPLFHPHQLHLQQQYNAQMQQHQVPITPHGLPPITPSMPPFNFLPPLGSPTTTNPNMPTHQAYQSYSQHPLPSPPMTMPMHLHIPGSPLHTARDQFQFQQKQAHDQQQRQQQQMQQNHQQRALGAFSLTGINPFAFPQPSPGGANGDSAFTPGASTFSPGVAMSPGAFWGRPGAGGANPMINPAVGAPVRPHAGSPGHGGLFYPAVNGGGGMPEPAGYFDSGYFPPMGGGISGLGASGLANEIMKDPVERQGRERERKVEGEGGEKVGGEDKNQGVDSSPFEADTSEDGLEPDQKGGERVRRHSSTTKTAWQATPGDLRVWEGREGVERRGEVGKLGGSAQETEAGTADSAVISRTHSMTSSKKPAGLLSHRSESDPPPIASSAGAESAGSSTEAGRPRVADDAGEGRQILEPNADRESR